MAMLGISYFLLSVLCGVAVVARLLPGRSAGFRCAAGSVLGILAAAWASYLLSLALGYAAGLALTALILCAGIAWGFSGAKEWRLPTYTPLGLVCYALLFGIAFRLYLTHSLTAGPDGWYVPGYTWADIALHMTIVSSTAFGDSVKMHLPVFFEAPLSYPFLVDFYSGVMLRLGAGWQLSFFLPGLTLFLSACALSVAFVRSIIGRGASLHLPIFLLAGSSWGLVEFLKVSNLGYAAVNASDYSNLAPKFLTFANPITSHFLPQRSFLMGFACAMLVFSLLHEYAKKRELAALLLAALVTGLVPFVHVHTFFVLCLVWAALPLAGVLKADGSYVAALVGIGSLAAPQLAWQFSAAYGSGFGRWYVGWMRPEGGSVLLFWLRNIGLMLPFLPAIPWVARKIGDRFLIAVLCCAAAIALACNIRIFQPNDFDNMKFMLYAYWAFAIPLAWYLDKALRTPYALFVPFALVLLCGSGSLAVARELSPDTNYKFLSADDIAFAADAKAIIPADARVLTASEHNNPISTLAGRSILIGYQGWLWSYGIDYAAEERARAQIVQGGAGAADAIEKYGLEYAVFTDYDITQSGGMIGTMMANYEEIYSRHGWHVFALRKTVN